MQRHIHYGPRHVRLHPNAGSIAATHYLTSWATRRHRNLKNGESRTALAIYNFGSTHLLWRVAVHGLELAMGEGQGGRHIHLTAHDFDVGPGFAGAG